MKRHVLICGLIGGVLITVLKWTEYQFLVLEHSVEIYGALTALTFALFGIWLGVRLSSRPAPTTSALHPTSTAVAPTLPTARHPLPEEPKRNRLGITRRELEILQLIAQGLSNREIAGKLFVSENTVKTHCSRAFDKLGARRRTQAVQLGKELGLLP
jgi:DNA-binding CsgD family transcriptional regulator